MNRGVLYWALVILVIAVACYVIFGPPLHVHV